MAQTVNEVTDLMSDTARRPKSKLQVPNSVKYLFMAMVLGLLVLILIIGGKALRDAPPAAIHVNHQGLTGVQYQSLQQVMNQQKVSSFFTSDNFGTERLVDAKGTVFVPADTKDLTQEKFATLQGEITQAPVIMQQMQQVNDWYAPLGIQVEDIILSPRMTWLIRFNNGLRVIVDNENTAQKLLNLSQLLGNQLSDRRDQIQSVDLRYKNGFTISGDMVQPKNDEAPLS